MQATVRSCVDKREEPGERSCLPVRSLSSGEDIGTAQFCVAECVCKQSGVGELGAILAQKPS